MADKPLSGSIADTFHLDPQNNSIFMRERHRRMAIELTQANDLLLAWMLHQQKYNVASNMSPSSWSSVVKYIAEDISNLNKLALKEGKP